MHHLDAANVLMGVLDSMTLPDLGLAAASCAVLAVTAHSMHCIRTDGLHVRTCMCMTVLTAFPSICSAAVPSLPYVQLGMSRVVLIPRH